MSEYESLKKENDKLKDKLKKMETVLKDNLFTKCVCCDNYFSGFESIPFVLGCMDVKTCMLDLHKQGITCFTQDLNYKLSNPWCTDCIPDDNISKRINNLNTMVVSNVIYNFKETGSPSPMTRECMDPKLSYKLYLPGISHEEMLSDLKLINIHWNEEIGSNDYKKITNYWGNGGRTPFRTELIEASYIVNSSDICNVLSKEEKLKRIKLWFTNYF